MFLDLKVTLFDLFADLGDWLAEQSKKKGTAIILVIISFFSPLGFLFASSFIASVYRKGLKRTKR